MYDICYTKTLEDRKAYIEYIDEQYNAHRLTQILTTVTEMIDAKVLNIAKQDEYHPIDSIQNFIPEHIRRSYHMIDVNVYQENIFHTKCKLKQFDLDNYLSGCTKEELHPGEAKIIAKKVKREMDEIFYGTEVKEAMFDLDDYDDNM